jgi:Flp pilus assembly protein TadG
VLQASKLRLRRFARDAKGNVAILFGICVIPLLLAVGVAVDYGRALVVRDRMADAADSAALAIGSWTGLTESQLKAKAQQYFDANFPPSAIGTVGKLNVLFVGDDINVTVSGQVPTTFMRLANVNQLDVGVDATITKKQRNIEVVLVLDTTGSMGSGGKLDALKNAAKKMVETLFGGNATSDNVKIGVVPYAAAVNVGADKLTSNPEWFDTNTYTTANNTADPIAFEDLDKTSGISTIKLYKGSSTGLSNRSWAGCVRERSANNNTTYELTDAPPSSSVAASRWVPYLAPDEPDSASGTNFSNNYISDGGTTATCVVGTTTNDKRQCRTAKYKNASVSSTSIGPDFSCPPAAITPMTNVASTINTAIDALVAKGNTVIPAGLLWGWRVISPGAPFTDGVDYSNDKVVKAIVLLTDGDNDVSQGSNGFNKSVYNAFGFAKNGHLGLTSGSNAEATLDTKTTTVCNAIKTVNPDNPILLYTIGFQVTTASQNLLKNCASTDEDGNKLFYNSPTNEQLASIFQDIAQGLSELRIAQ